MSFQPASVITVDTAHNVLDAGLQALGRGETNFDFGQVATVDSAAVAVLLAWQRAAKAQKKMLIMQRLPNMLQSLAKLYDVEALLTIEGGEPIPKA